MISKGQLKKLAHYVLENDELDSKAIKKLFKENNSLDLALFGRMVADDPALNVEAACQVAHAISTNEVIPEFDFYTAVDDKLKESETGSAMMGTIEYNSSTLYRYANINVKELFQNLVDKETTMKGVELFIKNFIISMPTGKQNTFANKTVPQYVMISIREDTPVNLVSAFEEPVKSNNGYIKLSIERLEKEYKNTEKFVEKPLKTLVLTTENSDLEQADNLKDLLKQIKSTLEMRGVDENVTD